SLFLRQAHSDHGSAGRPGAAPLLPSSRQGCPTLAGTMQEAKWRRVWVWHPTVPCRNVTVVASGRRMSKRAVIGVLALAAGSACLLTACSKGPSVAWTAPGWYLELPYPVIHGGPAVYDGPMTYDACEA